MELTGYTGVLMVNDSALIETPLQVKKGAKFFDLVAIGNSKPSGDSWFVGHYERRTRDHRVEKEVCSILKSAGSMEKIPF